MENVDSEEQVAREGLLDLQLLSIRSILLRFSIANVRQVLLWQHRGAQSKPS